MATIFESMESRLLREYFGEDGEARRDAERRLAAHEPLAYILGETVFFRESYFVTPDVLIPRPDTERLVEEVIRDLPRGGRFLDLCTGSGCVAISALCARPDATAVAVDLSEKALTVARKNAVRNRVEDRVTFLSDDILRQKKPLSGFDLIVSNPPYVKSDVVDTLEEECRREPRMAFDGGADGMRFYEAILRDYRSALRAGGKYRFLFEIGYDQKNEILALAALFGYSCEIKKDYGGNDRVAILTEEEKT